MPTTVDLVREDHAELVAGITRYGGRKLLASKMGLIYSRRAEPKHPPPGVLFLEEGGLLFGDFDLGFAVEVLDYVFEREHRRRPPPVDVSTSGVKTEHPMLVGNGFVPVAILLPTMAEMEADGRDSLALCVRKYGGPEQVARRLHLGYSLKDQEDFTAQLKEQAIVKSGGSDRTPSIALDGSWSSPKEFNL
ncbi:unnamed protein product [Discosporangium mesarthrocarpum]